MLGLRGLFAPIVTPFTDDGEAVSEKRLARLLAHLRARGVDGFICCTNTGEFTTTSSAERKRVLDITMREAKGMPVLAHCTRLGTLQTLDLVHHAAHAGAKAAVIMPPYFGNYGEEEIESHIRIIAQRADMPVIVLDPQHLVRSVLRQKLRALPDLHWGESTETAFRTRFAVDPIGAGSDEFVIEDAVVSPVVQIDPVAAKDTKVDVHPIARFVAVQGRPQVAKAALNHRGIDVGSPRPPSLALSNELVVELGVLVQTV